MKHLFRVLLFVVTVASVWSLDRTVCDTAIMGKWIGASVALMVSATALSLYFILKGRNADVNIIGSLDMAWPFTLTGFIVMAHSFLQMCSVLHAGNGIVDGLLYATADFDNPAGVATYGYLPFMSE